MANSLLLSVAKAVRRRARRLLRRFRPPAEPAPEQRPAAKRARLTRDLLRLKGFAAARPDPRLQITCAGNVDGVGAQAAAIMSALAFAEANNCTYVHTPLRSIAHAEGDGAAWTQRWESFLALGNSSALLCAELRSLGCEPSLQLFSEGPPDLFEAYREAGCELHLGADAFTTLHNLITADILVGALSGFSQIGGLISDGIVIDPWGNGARSVASIHRAMDGGFGRAQLAAALRAKL